MPTSCYFGVCREADAPTRQTPPPLAPPLEMVGGTDKCKHVPQNNAKAIYSGKANDRGREAEDDEDQSKHLPAFVLDLVFLFFACGGMLGSNNKCDVKNTHSVCHLMAACGDHMFRR